ncbi:MAG: ABC transporter ATP-binding protein [Firmicutes bacterium]|nr:ABC transporter ATP-binding protein [Bacillota bacterium]
MIETQNLVKTYRLGRYEVRALRGINFQANMGDFVAIMGASGSGKSTMMNIIGCLDTLSSGKYYLEGKDVSKIEGKQLAAIRNKKMGFVFQTFNLLPTISAEKNVELPMIYAGVSKRRRKMAALEALERVGIAERAHHKPNELSGGQKQRVAIARALVNKPPILLADEPTGNLDSASGDIIMEIFQSLNKEGVTVILVTHEREIALKTDRIVTFKDGLLINDEKIKALNS